MVLETGLYEPRAAAERLGCRILALDSVDTRILLSQCE